MKTAKNRWKRFKRELPSIIFLSVIQTYLNFTFPVFVRFGKPLSIIIPILLTILCIVIEIYFFVFEDKLPTIYTQEHYDNVPEVFKDDVLSEKFKKAERIFFIILLQIIYFFIWYYDFYKTASIYYFIYYLYTILWFYLIIRAIKNSQKMND